MTKPDQATALARKGNVRAAEEAVTVAIEKAESALSQWIPALELIVKASKGNSAETLAWAMLDGLEEQLDPKESIPHCGKILQLFSKNEEFRNRAAQMYDKVYGDVENLEQLVEVSGLKGGKPIRRAMQTLNLCLAAQPGCYLSHKDGGPAAKVISIEQPIWNVRVETPTGEELFDPVSLGDQYELADPHDFEVLRQFEPEQLATTISQKPAEFVVALLKKHGNELTTDQLEMMLCPRPIASGDWSKTWNKMRAALKKSPHVRLEGRNPIVLRYEDREISIEDDTWAKFSIHDTPKAWLDLAQKYLRECKDKGMQHNRDFLLKLKCAVYAEATGLEKRNGDCVLQAYLTSGEIGRLAGEDPDEVEATRCIDASESLRGTFSSLEDVYWPMALAVLKKNRNQSLPEDCRALIPICPPNRTDGLIEEIIKSGKQQLLADVAVEIMSDPITFLNGLSWLYLGPKNAELLAAPALVTLVSRLFGVLDQLRDSATVPADISKDLRARVRSTFSAKKYLRFEECISQIDEDMASALRTRIRLAAGLSDGFKADLDNRIHDRFAVLWVKPQKKTWEDTSTLYCTEAGFNAHSAKLDDLVNVKMKENAIAIGTAAAYGDLSENSEYKFALEERDLLLARVAELQSQMAIASVLQKNDAPTNMVGIGSRVILKNQSDAQTLTLTILGPWEADMDNHIINYQAPLGQRLMGVRIGEAVELEFGSHQGRFEVVSIEQGME